MGPHDLLVDKHHRGEQAMNARHDASAIIFLYSSSSAAPASGVVSVGFFSMIGGGRGKRSRVLRLTPNGEEGEEALLWIAGA